MERYSRQVLFEPIGADGQQRLRQACVTLVGCGALGSVLADSLTRAGVGHLRIIDRDFIELNNLQRQVLFDERDVAAHLPKAIAAQRKLQFINSEVTVEAIVEDANYRNIESWVRDADIILDGTDNFETRYLINDTACKHGIPWIYGACVSATGLVMAIVPHDTPCLKCVFEAAPPPEMSPTCDTAGVLGPVVGIVAGLQAIEALKILTGNRAAISRKLFHIDLWSGRIVTLKAERSAGDPPCPCCRLGQYDYLNGEAGQQATTLCGRDAVQILHLAGQSLDLQAIHDKLSNAGCAAVVRNDYLLQADLGEYQLTIFPTGRTIVKGTRDPATARSLLARYVGS